MKRILALVGAVALAATVGVAPAGADPVKAGSASAFAASVDLAGSEGVPPTPLAEIALPPGGEASETLVDVPGEPVAISGTLNADAVAHSSSDIESALTVVEQEVEGPYNVQGVALIEGLDVLLDTPAAGVSLVSADAVRAEAVAVCRGGSIAYSANSEIVDLDVAGEDVPLNAPVSDLIDAISDALETSGLNAVVDVNRNVVTELDGGGIAVDALVITIVEAGGPAALVTIGHAEVAGATCGDAPECSDMVDNADPEDTLADTADPGCHTDGNAGDPDTYDPNDDDETDSGGAAPGGAAAPEGQLPRTGGALDAGLLGATTLAALGISLHLLRRRVLAG